MIRPVVHIFFAIIMLFVAGIFLVIFLNTHSPENLELLEFAQFYLFVFFTIFPLALIIGYLFRRIFLPRAGRHESLRASTRQSFIFGVFAVIALVLQAFSILNLYTSILLLVIFSLIEIYAR